jgi:hypothetical protein
VAEPLLGAPNHARALSSNGKVGRYRDHLIGVLP